MKSFDEIMDRAAERGPRLLAVAGQVGPELEDALDQAASADLARCEPFEDSAAAVAAVHSGAAHALLKGNVKTSDFMRAILDKDNGLRSGKLISHVAVVEAFGRLILITDGGVCLNPTLDEKVEIIKNALLVAGKLCLAHPKVAVLAATEVVSTRMPETVDAEALAAMNIPGCAVQGPMAVDSAVDEHAARIKGVGGPVAGRADILLVPSVLVGNVFAKGIMYFAQSRFGGILSGTARPVAMLSRSDTVQTHLNTIALAVLASQED